MLNVLKNVEAIHLHECEMVGNIFEVISNFCPKLKVIEVEDCRTNADLFLNHYPMLEHFIYLPLKDEPMINELKVFLERHNQLKQFQTDVRILYTNHDLLINTNIKLDILNVRYIKFDHAIPQHFDKFIELLNTLLTCGFFKKLSFTNWLTFDSAVNSNNSICQIPQVKSLKTIFDSRHLTELLEIAPSRLSNLIELYIDLGKSDINTETLAINVPNLEVLTLHVPTIETILPFIRHCKNVKTIKLDVLIKSSSLSLFALNQERSKCCCREWHSQTTNTKND